MKLRTVVVVDQKVNLKKTQARVRTLVHVKPEAILKGDITSALVYNCHVGKVSKIHDYFKKKRGVLAISITGRKETNETSNLWRSGLGRQGFHTTENLATEVIDYSNY